MRIVLACFFSIFAATASASVYDNARVIYHAIGPKVHSPTLQGIDPALSIDVMDETLRQFVQQTPTLSEQAVDRIVTIRKSLERAKGYYLQCIELVNVTDEPSIVKKMAHELSQAAKSLAEDPYYPSILFVGGHYIHPEGGSLGGHTASYEVIRQDNGKLQFIINNTSKMLAKLHEIDANRIGQLIYSDLEPADVNEDFWRAVIQKTYMNPASWSDLMDGFYAYVDAKFSTKTTGRFFTCQHAGVCGWKSLSVWLHDKISDKPLYQEYKQFLFQNMLTNFKPKNAPKAAIIHENGQIEDATEYLLAELQRKLA